jgi:Holliday junction resolvase
MYTAILIRKTITSYRESVLAAINSLSSSKDKQYLRKEWLENVESWALCARGHSYILL